jgi:hypothetical protein
MLALILLIIGLSLFGSSIALNDEILAFSGIGLMIASVLAFFL